METWKKINEWYDVSDQGRVRSWMSSSKNKGKGCLVLKPYATRQGYVVATIYRKNSLIHRLVMEAFVGPSKLDVNHKNGVKDDNRLENLEYCTRSENMLHAHATGLLVAPKGISHHSAKLNDDKARIIYNHPGRVKDIAKEYGIGTKAVYKVKNRKTWAHATERLWDNGKKEKVNSTTLGPSI